MKKIKHILSALPLVLGLWMLSSCENEGFYFQGDAMIRMEGPYNWTVGTDSLLFSFVSTHESVTEINMEVTLHIMGLPFPQSRTARVGVVAANTTAESSQYVVPTQVAIPANALSATFPVTLKRSIDLQNTTMRLQIEVLDSDDFKVGAREYTHLLLKWNDILSMPTNWAFFEEFFGTFSVVKYRFMLGNGVPELSETMSWAQLMHYKVMLQGALDEYNAANPGNPLTDENGQIITF